MGSNEGWCFTLLFEQISTDSCLVAVQIYVFHRGGRHSSNTLACFNTFRQPDATFALLNDLQSVGLRFESVWGAIKINDLAVFRLEKFSLWVTYGLQKTLP